MAPQDVKIDVERDSEVLYSAAANASHDESSQSFKGFFGQDELARISGFTEAKWLLELINHLVARHLFRPLKFNTKYGWSVRPRTAAKGIGELTREEMMIYQAIEEGHTDGVWTKSIKNRTKIAQTVLTKALLRLEKLYLIKTVRNTKTQGQKIYMLFHLAPNDNVTGNSFYDAGELDEDFRDVLLTMIIHRVRQLSWAEVKPRKIKKEPTSSIMILDEADTEQTLGKRKRTSTTDIEEAGEMSATKRRASRSEPEVEMQQLAYISGFHDYPTAEAIHDWLINSQVIKATKANSLTVDEVAACIDILRWDKKIERIWNKSTRGFGYRTLRGVKPKTPSHMYEDSDGEGRGNGFTEAPCGRCPVFDICRDGGPVNPTDCTLFQTWLRADR